MYKSFLLIVALLAASAVQAETIEMKINGLVCGFCARGIEKTLRKDPATADVFVSLEDKLVAVVLQEGRSIPDDVLTKEVTNAGYTVKHIERTTRSIAEIRASLGKTE